MDQRTRGPQIRPPEHSLLLAVLLGLLAVNVPILRFSVPTHALSQAILFIAAGTLTCKITITIASAMSIFSYHYVEYTMICSFEELQINYVKRL